MITRRRFVSSSLAASACALAALTPDAAASDPIAPYRTPYKYPELVLKATGNKADYDGISVDDPIVFRANGRFHMLYIGFDGAGYQTGLAAFGRSHPLDAHSSGWPARSQLAIHQVQPRRSAPFCATRTCMAPAKRIKVDGQYLAAWNAYPSAGYEAGAAVIGLARSHDLLHWTLTEPILSPADGAPWEHGGLYRPDLLLDRGTYYLYYNAKTDASAEVGRRRLA